MWIDVEYWVKRVVRQVASVYKVFFRQNPVIQSPMAVAIWLTEHAINCCACAQYHKLDALWS